MISVGEWRHLWNHELEQELCDQVECEKTCRWERPLIVNGVECSLALCDEHKEAVGYDD